MYSRKLKVVTQHQCKTHSTVTKLLHVLVTQQCISVSVTQLILNVNVDIMQVIVSDINSMLSLTIYYLLKSK